MLRQFVRSILLEGMLEAPPAMVDTVFNWVMDEIASYRQDLKDGKRFSLDVSTEIPIDLTGWKYDISVDDYANSMSKTDEIVAFVEEEGRKRNLPRAKIQSMLDVLIRGSNPENYKSIKVRLVLKSSVTAASWHPATSTLSIFMRAGQKPEELRSDIEHELRHLSQTILSNVRLGKDIGAGMPSKKIKTLDGMGSGQDTARHHQYDIEFYPMLGTTIDKAKRDGVTPDDAREWMASNKFFKELKRTAPGKYRKAAKEFLRSL